MGGGVGVAGAVDVDAGVAAVVLVVTWGAEGHRGTIRHSAAADR